MEKVNIEKEWIKRESFPKLGDIGKSTQQWISEFNGRVILRRIKFIFGTLIILTSIILCIYHNFFK